MKCKYPLSVSRVPAKGGLLTLESFLPKFVVTAGLKLPVSNNMECTLIYKYYM